MVHKIGCVGAGFVGQAVITGFETLLRDKVDVRVYDKYKDTESLNSVVNNSSIIFSCLPTPMNEDGSCNASIVEQVLAETDEIAVKPKTIILKSTVPPGTTDRLQKQYKRHTFIFNPEFLTEKNFLNDFLEQDRIVLGLPEGKQHTKRVMDVFSLYHDFIKAQDKPATVYTCRPKESEMVKYMANCFLASKVILFNEFYDICQAANVDYTVASSIACTDKRIGSSHINVPGHDGYRGMGGACFSKDMNSLMFFAKSLGVDPLVLESVWTKNLLVREYYDWENLAQVNGNYKKE